jgi:thiamine-monophosphate kinase
VMGPGRALQMALTGGDDYELCFTVPALRLAELPERLAGLDCPVTCIGTITSEPGISVRAQGRPMPVTLQGYDHFAGGQ